MSERHQDSAPEWDDQSWALLDEAVRRLEEAWKTSPNPDLSPLVPPQGDPRREWMLVRLIRFDQECRWEAGDRKKLEQYLGEWPELGDRPEVIAELLAAECLTRAIFAEIPTPDELRSRFPEIGDKIDLAEVEAEAKREGLSSDPTTASASADAQTDSWKSCPAGDRAPSALPAGHRLGRYKIRGVLGHGGMATVYLAHDEELQRPVAIKVPLRKRFKSDEEMDRFSEEARTLARLKHPAVVPIYDVGRDDDGTPFVVMEYVEGSSLEALLKSERLSHSRVAELVIQIAEAVHYAHKQGFIHRDLKPANILLDQSGELRVADFGLAVHEDVQDLRAGEYSGTLPYMAPEQARGDAHLLDGRADIWAIGVMLYEMLTGRRPFRGDSPNKVREEILRRDPKPPRQIDDGIPKELERICLKCLLKQATDRYTTASDVVEALRRWQRPATSGLLPRLSGTIDVLIWNEAEDSRRGLSLRDHGALPLNAGDQIRVSAQLNRPAYVYLLWIDASGTVIPVYPWTPGNWSEKPSEESPTDRVSLPKVADKGWPMEPPSGMETLLLLARETPLPDDLSLQESLAMMPSKPIQDPRALVWFADGNVVSKAVNHERGPQFFDPKEIDDPVLKTQRMIQEKLGVHFALNRAVSFANQVR